MFDLGQFTVDCRNALAADKPHRFVRDRRAVGGSGKPRQIRARIGYGIMVLWRKRSAHLHRPWRAKFLSHSSIIANRPVATRRSM